MNFIKKVQRKLRFIFFRITSIIKIVLQSFIYRNRIYLIGVPIHGNLGDQAILLAEEKFLKENFKNTKIIEVESKLVMKHKKLLKKIGGVAPLLIHGGGFLGSLWIHEEEMFRTVLETFPNNKIIVFPQTIFFSDDKEGKEALEESKKIYQAHKNLTICCREKFSYEFMEREFPKCNIILVPDMVLYLNNMPDSEKREGVLFCIRKDKEKVQYNFEEIEQIAKEIGKIDYTDTIKEKNIYTYKDRVKSVERKLEQFSKYKLVVTDRLHGMIFAFLSNTPCLVYENKSYKIKGVYEWIEDCNYIKLSKQQDIKDQIGEILKQEKKQYNKENLLKTYEPLIDVIKKSEKRK